MKLSERFRVWLFRRGALAIFIALAVLLWIFQIWSQRPQPRISHVLGPSAQNVDVLWFKQGDISNLVDANDGRVAFMMPLAEDGMTAIDTKNANPIWKVEFPFERSGTRGMLTGQNTIFTVNSTRVDAYEAATGELKWSTELGNGHVSVIPQLDSARLRIYYGDKLIELDPKTGEILNTKPKDGTLWVSDNIVLQSMPTNQLTALDKLSGELLWTNARSFYIDEGQEPLNMDADYLIVGFVDGICALNLRTGEYRWCRPAVDIANTAIDHQFQLGYAMRDDLTLLTIDLPTGNILGETRFLSSKPIDEQIGSVSSIIASNGVVVVSFSDSGQTFGLKFK